jgi:Xaa-Pro aminopeptidase
MYQERIEAVRQLLPQWKVDGLLVTSPANRRWLSGFTGTTGDLLITAGEAWLATDFRYWEQAQQQAPDFRLYQHIRGQKQTTAALIAGQELATLAVESSHMSLKGFATLQKGLAEAGVAEGAIDLRPLDETVEPLRQVKSAAELDKMQAAAAITDMAMAAVPRLVKPGMSEVALAWELEKLMRENGAEALAFPIIVAGGPNAALAHHRPGPRPLQAGDAIVVDMGAAVDGYMSDLTRTFHLGEPDEKFWQIYNLTLAAQQAALTGIKAALSGKACDALARDVIAAGDQAEAFGHSLGHGVGLEVHEGPGLNSQNDKPIPAGAVVTVEPGIYLSGWGGVRIEDLVVVTETGAERLSHCPKEPVIL